MKDLVKSLVTRAGERGHSIYEELQSGDVIKDAIADWNDIIVDTAKGSAKDAEHIFKLLHPTLDAQPGRHTLEDVIDPIIFDPQSNLAPLEMMALGMQSGTKAAAKGIAWAGKKMAWKVDDMYRGIRGGEKVAKEAAEEVAKIVPKAVPKRQPSATVLEGMQHAQGGASPESISRRAAGVRTYRMNRAGVATEIPQGGEDAAARMGEAIIEVVPGQAPWVKTGKVVGKTMQDAMGTLKPGKVRDVSKAKTVTLDLAKDMADEDEFLKSLGVQGGRGPKPPR